MRRQHDVVCRLVDAGGDPNQNGYADNSVRPMLFTAACTAGSLGLLKGLLEKGADPNIRDPADGKTALHHYRRSALARASIATVKTLLEHGASPELADHEGETPLHAIAHTGTLEECKLCLDRCADAVLHRETPHGETLLHYAAAGKRIDVMEYLIDRGLDINAVNNNGWTPLLCALMPTSRTGISAAEDAANLLLRHGARADTVTAENWTPIHALASWPVRYRDNDAQTVGPRLARELISRGASLDAEASVLRGSDVTASAVCGKWGFRMQRLAETERGRKTEDTVPDEETTPHMWASRTKSTKLFRAILDH